MASLQCHKETEKGLNQGYYGGSSMGHNDNWGYKATKKENKYQGPQNGYAMGYAESECYSQIHNPTHGMSKSQKAYGMADTWDEYGQSYGTHKSQNGKPMSKTQVHGRGYGYGNGFGSHSNNGIPQMQAYGSSNYTSPGKHEGRGYGYGGPSPTPGYQKNSDHRNYEITEAYGYDETNGYGEYANNGMVRSQAHLRGKHPGHGNGFIKTQAYGENETCEYNETNFPNESQYYGGARGYHAGNDHSGKGLLRKTKDGYSGNNSCSDTESDNDDDDYGMRKVWISKAI